MRDEQSVELGDLLVPPPHSLVLGDGTTTVRGPVEIVVASTAIDARPACERLQRALARHGCAVGTGGTTVVLTARASRPAPRGGRLDESYRLGITTEGIEITAATGTGWRHGVATLAQWLRLHHDPSDTATPALSRVEIDDRPDFAHRGVLLDISRDKVPTVATVMALVERLADWKINQLQLYMEHTFAYPGHETVWRDASPWTARDVRTLDAHCQGHGITLVPNQNSFGHFHRWLLHDAYRPLAECPEGIDHPFSMHREPFSLCATDPRCLDLLGGLYDDLLPCFRSRQLNVGLDETFDLGLGRSAAACEARGRDRVYLDFVQAVHGVAADRGHTLQMWGDIVLQHPERIVELPDDVVALAWGYEADHPFAEELPHFQAAGRSFYVCPGTSSWLSFGGRLTNALLNLGRAAHHGRAAEADGLLITDWGDRGHWQPPSVREPGLLAGAALAWNADAWGLVDGSSEVPLAQEPVLRKSVLKEPLLPVPMARLLDLHVFDGAAKAAAGDPAGAGAAVVALGELYRATGTPSRNGSALFYLLMAPEDDLNHVRYMGLDDVGLASIEARTEAIQQAVEHGVDDPQLRLELSWVARLLHLGARLGRARLAAGATAPVEALPAATKRSLRVALDDVMTDHATVWRAQHRPGGREDSLARMAPLRLRLA